MTDRKAQYKEMARALFKDDTERAQQISNDMGDESWQGTGQLLLAIFGKAADLRFKEDSSHDAVMGFVRETQEAFANAQTPLNPLHVELLIRAALGEDDLFQQVPSNDATALMLPLSDKMIADLQLSHQQIDGFLDEAEALVS